MSLGESASPAAAAVAVASQFAAGGHELPSMDGIHDLVHSALTRLLQLLPSSPTVLFPLLVESFPHKRNDVTIQLVYVKNLLRVSEYAGSLRDRILTTIIERMIHIDVEIVHDVEGDAVDEAQAREDEEDDLLDDDDPDGHMVEEEEPHRDDADLMFAMGNGDATTTTGAPASSPVAPVSKRLTESRVMANKLDSLMCLMFEYLNLIRIAAADSTPKSNTPKAVGGAQASSLLAAAGTNNSSVAANNGTSAANQTGGDLCDEVFSSLLRVFERSILRTHNSRFLQFLLFYYCSFKHVYAETFLKYLMTTGFEVQTSNVERQNSALYIASFVARASFLRHASAIVAFEMLLKWTHAYTEYHLTTSQAALAAAAQNSYTPSGASLAAVTAVPEVGPLEASQHAVFYRMCQAVFYIFCYRQSSFRDMLEQNPEILHSLRLDALIFSPLNPLRYISQTVIEEFLRVNDELGRIVECDELVQRNHRLNQSSRVGAAHGANGSSHAQRGSNGDASGGGITGGNGGSSASLTATRFDPNDIFFPFDPYQLKHSSAYIDNLYIVYRHEEESDEEEYEDEEDAEDDFDDDVVRHGGMEDDVSSRGSARSQPRLSKPIRIGGGMRPSLTDSPALDASVSSMSASFSDRLSVDDSGLLDATSHSEAGAVVNMSFEMSPGQHLLHMSTPADTPQARAQMDTPATGKKTRRARDEISFSLQTPTPAKSRRQRRAPRNDTADDDEDDDSRGLVLSEQDLSFSPNSPSFAPLVDDSPVVSHKFRRK